MKSKANICSRLDISTGFTYYFTFYGCLFGEIYEKKHLIAVGCSFYAFHFRMR